MRASSCCAASKKAIAIAISACPSCSPLSSQQNGLHGQPLFRESSISATDVAASGRKPGEYYVARLRVGELEALHLTVVPDEPPTGHVRLAELSYAAYERDKERWKPVLIELARLASAQIVHGPTGNRPL